MTKLRGKYREANRASGKPAVNGWQHVALEFWHLLNTTYHCSGRGLEVSLGKPEDIRASRGS
jgi:hypothetical protein